MPEILLVNGKWLSKLKICHKEWRSICAILLENHVSSQLFVYFLSQADWLISCLFTFFQAIWCQTVDVNQDAFRGNTKLGLSGMLKFSDIYFIYLFLIYFRYNFQHLLAIDPDNPHNCPTIRAFKFPSACVCHFEYPNHQKDFYWKGTHFCGSTHLVFLRY